LRVEEGDKDTWNLGRNLSRKKSKIVKGMKKDEEI